MSPVKWILATIGCLALLAGIVIGGWQLGWWMKSYSVSRNAQIYHNSYGAQSADEQQAQNLITQVSTIQVQITDPAVPPAELPALRAQENNIITQACAIIENITQPTPDVVSFASQNC